LTIVRSRSRIMHAMAPAWYHVAGLAGTLASARRVCHPEFPPGSGEIEWAFRFRPDLVLACYEKLVGEVADTVKRTSPSTRLVSLSNAIHTALFVPPPDRLPERVSVLRQGTRHVVLIVGHLSEVKGLPSLPPCGREGRREDSRCGFSRAGGRDSAARVPAISRASRDRPSGSGARSVLGVAR
jgi:hypothetical protein